MPATVLAIDLLGKGCPDPCPAVCVLFGDEPFLKQLAKDEIRRVVLGESGEDDFALTRLGGASAAPSDVFDELATVSLFGGHRRMVVLDEAETFVTAHRAALERYVAAPAHTGVLLLEVAAWPSNTKLYKALATGGLQVDCRTPKPAAAMKWLVDRAQHGHGAKLARPAAALLLEIVGLELGQLDQELAKLASAIEPGQPIDADAVNRLVAGWRVKTIWEMLDAAAAGNASKALLELDRLLVSGGNAVALLGQISSSLRRLAAAARYLRPSPGSKSRPPIRKAIEVAGVPPYFVDKAEAQLRQIGSGRAEQLYSWLLEADLAIKGPSSAPGRARIVLERLIARLSKAADPRQAQGAAHGQRT